MVDYKVGDWVQRSAKEASYITPHGIYEVVGLAGDSVYVIANNGKSEGYYASEFKLAKNKIVSDILRDL